MPPCVGDVLVYIEEPGKPWGQKVDIPLASVSRFRGTQKKYWPVFIIDFCLFIRKQWAFLTWGILCCHVFTSYQDTTMLKRVLWAGYDIILLLSYRLNMA